MRELRTSARETVMMDPGIWHMMGGSGGTDRREMGQETGEQGLLGTQEQEEQASWPQVLGGSASSVAAGVGNWERGGQEGVGWRVSGSERVQCVAHTRRGGALTHTHTHTHTRGALTHTHTHTHTHTSDGLRAVASGKPFIKLNYFT